MHLAPFVLAALLLVPGTAADTRRIVLQALEVYSGFDFPVSFAFAPDGRVFVTEKAGAIKVVDGGSVATWAQVSVVDAGEQGLLGLALHPDFAANGRVYLYFSTATGNRIGYLTEAGGVGTNLAIVVSGIPSAPNHNGGVLAFARDGTLFASTGDAGDAASAQDVGSVAGKVLRANGDGSVPPDNPFPGNLVFSRGHRNVFGLAVDPETGDLWETENGPDRDDEVNRIVAGGNYGWPDETGVAGRPEFVDPAFVFASPLPALTQATFHGGHLYFGAWNSGAVYRAVLTADRRGIADVAVIHTFEGAGVTDVESGPDGLYASVVYGGSGAIFRLASLNPAGTGDHWLTFGVAAAAIAGLFGLYLWKRRRVRGRERS